MPFYHTLGNIPRKRHTAFRRADGELFSEHLMGSRGFSGPATLLYHRRRPTSVLSSRMLRKLEWREDPNAALRMRHFHLAKVPAAKSLVLDRMPLLYNRDVAMEYVALDRPNAEGPHDEFAVVGAASRAALAPDPARLAGPTGDDFFYRNGQGDELIYVSQGSGVLETQMGELTYAAGDYLVIPRGILHRYLPAGGLTQMLVMESAGAVRPPSRYCNERGQFVEHSPYCERDIRRPATLPEHDEPGEFKLLVKQNNVLTELVLDHHPLDVVGWDGYYYPWALSIHDFEPITGSLHQPPPVHQTFQGDGFVVCSFVPRLFDYHKDAVPAPYNHSNVESDEVLYYANDEFMSRKGIGYGSLTLHPCGLPHGPHPGRAEASIGKSRTNELAVMLDSFRPLNVARDPLAYEDPDYLRSWLDT